MGTCLFRTEADLKSASAHTPGSVLRRKSFTVKTKLLFLFLFIAVSPTLIFSQVTVDARGGDAALRVGGTVSLFRPDYFANAVGGGGVYVDFDLDRRLGLEATGRWLRKSSGADLHEDQYAIGPRVSFLTFGRVHPYAKGFIGLGEFTFPNNAGFVTGHGGYLLFGGGAGVDYRLNRKWTIRPIDFEYQHWPDFTTGAINPYGVSIGASYRIF